MVESVIFLGLALDECNWSVSECLKVIQPLIHFISPQQFIIVMQGRY